MKALYTTSDPAQQGACNSTIKPIIHEKAAIAGNRSVNPCPPYSFSVADSFWLSIACSKHSKPTLATLRPKRLDRAAVKPTKDSHHLLRQCIALTLCSRHLYAVNLVSQLITQCSN